jgi:hypothetical protein
MSTPMPDTDLFQSVASQLLAGDYVEVGGKRLCVRRTSARRLRCVGFEMNDRHYEAIEQNPDKPSRWGQLARDGHQVVQFKDAETNRFVAVAVDGKVQVYGNAPRT